MTDKQERSPREQLAIELIQAAAMIITISLAPVIERMMSDPDISFRLRWIWKHRVQAQLEMWLHEVEMVTETAVGLYQASDYLRRQWKKDVSAES